MYKASFAEIMLLKLIFIIAFKRPTLFLVLFKTLLTALPPPEIITRDFQHWVLLQGLESENTRATPLGRHCTEHPEDSIWGHSSLTP